MKKNILIIVFCCVLCLSLSSCFEDNKIVFDQVKLVELEDAVKRTPAAGAKFPIISVNRGNTTQNLQVNLIGTHLKSAEVLKFSIDTTISAFLNANTIRAVEGVHFSLNGGEFTLKSDTSFATMSFNILDPGQNAGKSALLLLKLDGNSTLKPNENYRRVGYRINLN